MSKELDNMSWSEFSMFLNGIGHDTPLGNIVSIRAENDAEVVRKMSPAQKRIRNEWRQRQFKKRPPKDVASIYDGLQQALKKMAGYEEN